MRFVFSVLVLLFLTTCNQESSGDNPVNNQEQGHVEMYDDGKVVSDTNVSSTNNSRGTTDPLKMPLNYLEKSVDQYPSTVNFLGNLALRARMERLLGSAVFSEVQQIWKQETILEMHGGLIYTTAQNGPEKEDPRVAVMIDIGRDLLFVGVKHFESAEDQIYVERNADIPVRLKNWSIKE